MKNPIPTIKAVSPTPEVVHQPPFGTPERRIDPQRNELSEGQHIARSMERLRGVGLTMKAVNGFLNKAPDPELKKELCISVSDLDLLRWFVLASTDYILDNVVNRPFSTEKEAERRIDPFRGRFAPNEHAARAIERFSQKGETASFHDTPIEQIRGGRAFIRALRRIKAIRGPFDIERTLENDYSDAVTLTTLNDGDLPHPSIDDVKHTLQILNADELAVINSMSKPVLQILPVFETEADPISVHPIVSEGRMHEGFHSCSTHIIHIPDLYLFPDTPTVNSGVELSGIEIPLNIAEQFGRIEKNKIVGWDIAITEGENCIKTEKETTSKGGSGIDLRRYLYLLRHSLLDGNLDGAIDDWSSEKPGEDTQLTILSGEATDEGVLCITYYSDENAVGLFQEPLGSESSSYRASVMKRWG